jgi:hypothetical protein
VASVDLALATSGTEEITRLPVGGPGWRYEVTGAGRYWQWRRGSGRERQSIYGGAFETLPEERREAYHGNRKSKARTKTSQQTDRA